VIFLTFENGRAILSKDPKEKENPMTEFSLYSFAPSFEADSYTDEEKWLIEPFFTNLDKSVYGSFIPMPETIGALCSRTSRASGDLRKIFLKEFIVPFVKPERTPKDTDETFAAKTRYGGELGWFIRFLHEHPFREIFLNPRARTFYITCFAQYGDESVAQMAGTHIIFSGISNILIKHLENQRIALAPIEKSTRYVDYGEKVNGGYRYYTDPTLASLGLLDKYREAMDGLFETYLRLREPLIRALAARYPEEKPSVIEKKAFDTLRGLLPMATLSQVSFFGNGQSLEYAINRSAQHGLGEIRWGGDRMREELMHLIPTFLHRVHDPNQKEMIERYQEYLAGRRERIRPLAAEVLSSAESSPAASSSRVELVEYDPDGEEKVIAGILYEPANNRWSEILNKVRAMDAQERRKILDAYLYGRDKRWQKVGRAFEHAVVLFEVEMNIGAWRDLQRHRMLTQQNQEFTCDLGFDIPPELTEFGLEDEFSEALERAGEIQRAIASCDPALAQYAVPFAYRVRFIQRMNLRQCFWQGELRTIPEGHPDYRHIEQEKYRLLKQRYPLIAAYMLVNEGEYDFARRGQEEKIQKKIERLEKTL
jgi:thymidylate synthase ThyX